MSGSTSWRKARLPDGSLIPGYLFRKGLEVEADRDALGDEPDGPAVVLVNDYERGTWYSVVAVEDEQGRARLLSLAMGLQEDVPGEVPNPVRYLDEATRRDERWLARVAIECFRGSSIAPDERLAYVAATVRRCEREGVSSLQVLHKALHLEPRSISRLIAKAVEAGLLDERRKGRPSKFDIVKESPNA